MLTSDQTRITAAFAVSLAIHAALLSMHAGWTVKKGADALKNRRVTMTLTPRVIRKQVVPPPLEKSENNALEQLVLTKPVTVPAEPEKALPTVPASPKASIEAPVEVAVRELPAPVFESERESDSEIMAEKHPESLPEPVAKNSPVTTAGHDDGLTGQDVILPVIIEARPLYKENPPPRYPAVARRRHYEGTTLLEVDVDNRGRVSDLRIFQTSGHAVLDRAALETVRDWLFEPATRDGEKIDAMVRIPVTFRLR